MKKVLIVEDDPVTRKLLVKGVERLGYVVISASNGRRASEFLEDNPDMSLIITDMAMPDMNGRSLILLIKGQRNLQHIPIIMVSGVVRVSEIQDLLELGVEYFVPKPIELEHFTSYVQNLLSGELHRSNQR